MGRTRNKSRDIPARSFENESKDYINLCHIYKFKKYKYNSLYRYIGENTEHFSPFFQGFSLEDIYHSIGVLSINNANLAMGEGHGKGAGLYVTYSRVNHGCTCNTKTLKYKDNR